MNETNFPKTDAIIEKYYQNRASGADHGLTNEDVQVLIHQLHQYQQIALCTAGIIGATAIHFLQLKSTSKSECERQLRICDRITTMLEAESSNIVHAPLACRKDKTNFLKGIKEGFKHRLMNPGIT